jgi:hypothetical protein
MAFPSSPTNGQQATVNGVVYTYSSSLTAWTVTTNFTGNITVNQINAATISTSGNAGATSFTGGSLSVTGTVTAASTVGGVITGSSASVTGAVTAASTVGGVITGSSASASGTVTGGNLVTGGTLSVTGLTTLGANLTITGHSLPSANATYDLGSTTARWRNIYTNDLQLNNGIGDYTIVEGEDDLFLYNNKKGKVYKFALIEVDPTIAPPKAKTD